LFSGNLGFEVSSGQISIPSKITPVFKNIPKTKSKNIPFDYFQGDLKLEKGTLKSKKLYLKNSDIQMQFQGAANLKTETVSGVIESHNKEKTKNLLVVTGDFKNPIFRNKNP